MSEKLLIFPIVHSIIEKGYSTFGYLRDHSVRNANNVRPIIPPSGVFQCVFFDVTVDGNFGVWASMGRLAGELSPIFR